MADLDELALAMPQMTKELSDDGRPAYLVHDMCDPSPWAGGWRGPGGVWSCVMIRPFWELVPCFR